jgi:protein arginine N-methyltransferase 1
MYSVADYGRMIHDAARLEAYTQALQQAVNSDTVVADVGAGTGIFTVLACRMGARRVYALEPGEAFTVLQEVVAENGFSDRVQFLPRLSTEVTLPERAHVVISDLRGALPLYDHHLAAILDIRARHLAPGGTLIAARDTLRVAVAAAPELYRRLMGPWGAPGRVSFEATRRYVANGLYHPREQSLELLSAPGTWCEIDYRTFHSLHAAGKAELVAERPGAAHGLLVWFDCETIAGCSFSNAPGANPNSVYQQRMLCWPEAITLRPGEVVEAEILADPVGDDYTWRWNTTVRGADGKPRQQFRQSTFFASPISAETLALRAAGHRPALNEEGAIERFILERMDGSRPLQAIADEVRERFPGHFADSRKALDRVAMTSARFSRRNGG